MQINKLSSYSRSLSAFIYYYLSLQALPQAVQILTSVASTMKCICPEMEPCLLLWLGQPRRNLGYGFGVGLSERKTVTRAESDTYLD